MTIPTVECGTQSSLQTRGFQLGHVPCFYDTTARGKVSVAFRKIAGGTMAQSVNDLTRLSRSVAPLSRRQLLRMALTGVSGLTLPGLLQLRAQAALPSERERTSLIVVFLHGGASHLETYDPKPLAPSEYRGPFTTIPTAVSGLNISELLPQHARIATKFTVLRSMVHSC